MSSEYDQWSGTIVPELVEHLLTDLSGRRSRRKRIRIHATPCPPQDLAQRLRAIHGREIRAAADLLFLVDGSTTGQQVLDPMIIAFGLPFIEFGRKPHRDDEGCLRVRHLTPNGAPRILLLENGNRILIKCTPSPLAGFPILV